MSCLALRGWKISIRLGVEVAQYLEKSVLFMLGNCVNDINCVMKGKLNPTSG